MMGPAGSGPTRAANRTTKSIVVNDRERQPGSPRPPCFASLRKIDVVTVYGCSSLKVSRLFSRPIFLESQASEAAGPGSGPNGPRAQKTTKRNLSIMPTGLGPRLRLKFLPSTSNLARAAISAPMYGAFLGPVLGRQRVNLPAGG